jgi:hypothetical protein
VTARRSIFIVVIVVVVIAIALMLRYPGKASIKLKPELCEAELWNHVYEKERLRIIEPCTTVEGRVVKLGRGADGDLHIDLDPDNRAVLNLINVIHTHRNLVVEIICEHPPTREAAIKACEGFRSQVLIPQVGDRIRVTGSYVRDTETGWNEIHPVTKIQILH